MIEWLQDTVHLCGQRCAMIDIGQSYEGRRLPVIKVRSLLACYFNPLQPNSSNYHTLPYRPSRPFL